MTQAALAMVAASLVKYTSDKTLHLIVDNYATHKHPAVQKWLANQPDPPAACGPPTARRWEKRFITAG